MAIDLKLNRQAHVAGSAVEKTILATDTTDAAGVAVILTLIIVVKEITDQAGVSSETNATFLAVHLNPLSRIALGANQLRNRFTIECVIFHFIVTITTHVDFAATWTLLRKC